MIQDKSMLVDLTISKWGATKHDKAVSIEVEQAHAAKDAGRYNKRLIDKAHLATIDTIAGQMRKYHYSRTLPWSDKGQRLLPSKLFMEYRQDIAAFKTQFDNAKRSFLTLYPQLVHDARLRLGTMYQPSDYPDPSELQSAFNVELLITPVPDAGDFRVEVDQETKDELRRQITEAVNERQARAVKDCYNRAREVLQRIVEQCSKKDGRIHDSLMGNAEDLVSVLSGLNITDDPGIAQLEQDLADLIAHPDAIRASPSLRKNMADNAADILAKMPWS
jgi:hypothetical protein